MKLTATTLSSLLASALLTAGVSADSADTSQSDGAEQASTWIQEQAGETFQKVVSGNHNHNHNNNHNHNYAGLSEVVPASSMLRVNG